jgi:PAS domain S-box-containing protein
MDGIAISEHGTIVEVSEGLLERSGYTRGEVIGRPVMDFIAPECREAVVCTSDATEWRLDTIGVTKSGQRRRIEVVGRRHALGERTVRLIALRDVTEACRLEDQLQHAQEMEALARLASGIAHDVNNVLLIIRFFGDMLIEDRDEPHRRVAREILRAVDSGAALTRLLLAYARQAPVTLQLLNLNSVVRESERLLRHLLGEGVELAMDLAPDLAEVLADPTQLQQVILNLAINARDAMPQGGACILRTRNVDAGAADGLSLRLDHRPPASRPAPRAGRYAALLVRDSGTGMSHEVQARMFDPFFTTKQPGEGTGLGLAIVYQVVEQCGGFIAVESAVGAGTTFSIHLPQVSADR